MKKLFLLGAVAAGYVLGARAGRQRYETIKSGFLKVKNNPTVQNAASTAAEKAKEQAPVVADKVSSAAAAAVDKVKPGGSDDLTDQLNPESTARQENPYPQGDLP
jgi:hypothetical protein